MARAGGLTKWFKENLSDKIKIVRAMPNTPASVLKGITGIFHSNNLIKDEICDVSIMFEAIGKVVFLKKENLIDIVTSISGSGPAYFFFLTEILSKLGIKFGLEENDAKDFAKSTFIGAASLLEGTDLLPSTLRKNVTSPGGTTESALEILMKKNNGLEELIEKALDSAIFRAKELNKE